MQAHVPQRSGQARRSAHAVPSDLPAGPQGLSCDEGVRPAGEGDTARVCGGPLHRGGWGRNGQLPHRCRAGRHHAAPPAVLPPRWAGFAARGDGYLHAEQRVRATARHLRGLQALQAVLQLRLLASPAGDRGRHLDGHTGRGGGGAGAVQERPGQAAGAGDRAARGFAGCGADGPGRGPGGHSAAGLLREPLLGQRAVRPAAGPRPEGAAAREHRGEAGPGACAGARVRVPGEQRVRRVYAGAHHRGGAGPARLPRSPSSLVP
mmetsp:Transcript_15158/g.33443  ORF Transcript_15158/g.33443 Transcript_15158/m.33443 type:complete len:263 (-) Transcript_15158:75-863(-)